MSRNYIRIIEIGVFNGLVNFNILEFFDNRFIIISNGVFVYLFKLKEFWLRNNFIESIFFYVFNRIFFLRRLDLGELKRFLYILEGVFEGLFNLRYLNFVMCNFREIFNFTSFVKFDELDFFGNYLFVIRFGFF